MNTNEERTEKQLDIFMEPPMQVGELKMRPFSAGTLTLCRKLGLTMLLGNAEDKATLSDEEKQRQITTFLFIQCAPLDDVKRAAKLARENRAAFEDELLLNFELSLPVGAMAKAIESLAGEMDRIGAAQFETVPKEALSGGVAESPPPND